MISFSLNPHFTSTLSIYTCKISNGSVFQSERFTYWIGNCIPVKAQSLRLMIDREKNPQVPRWQTYLLEAASWKQWPPIKCAERVFCQLVTALFNCLHAIYIEICIWLHLHGLCLLLSLLTYNDDVYTYISVDPQANMTLTRTHIQTNKHTFIYKRRIWYLLFCDM